MWCELSVGHTPLHSRLRMLFASVIIAMLPALLVDTPVALAQEPFAGRLDITIAPPLLPADGGTQSVIYVQLVGPDAIPRLAPVDMEIALISSDPRVARVPELMHISQSKSFAVAAVTTTSVPGKVTISATSAWLDPVGAQLETVGGIEGSRPWRIDLDAAPGKMLPGGRPPGRLSITLVGADGRSVPAPQSMDVVVSSSDPEVVGVPERVTIPEGAHFVTTELVPKAVGTVTLSAVGAGFVSEFIEVHVTPPGEIARTLVLYPSPPLLRSPGPSQPQVIVQALDDSEKPVHFPCTRVHLASSFPETVEVASASEAVCDGSAQYTTVTLSVGGIPGTVTISASVEGLRPAAADVTVHGQVPAQITAYAAPKGVLGIEATPGFLVAQVLDEVGLPATMHEDTLVKVLVSDGSFPKEIVVPAGSSFGTLELGWLQPGAEVDLWLSNPALSSAQLSVVSSALPITAVLEASEGPLFPGDGREVVVRVQSSGSSLEQAKLIWSATNGSLSNISPETDGNGEGRAILTATEPGNGVVQVLIEKPGYREYRTEADIAVVAPPVADSRAPKLVGVPVLYLLVAFAAILFGYVAYKSLPGLKRRLKIWS